MKPFQLVVLGATLLTLNLPVSAEELSAEKRADIELLLKTTGALNIGQQFADVVVQSNLKVLKDNHPDIPEATLNLVSNEIRNVIAENLPGLRERIIPIYHNQYSGAEIKQLLQFYDSELGKKVIRLMPVSVQEGMKAGQSWGESLQPELKRRIEAKLEQASQK